MSAVCRFQHLFRPLTIRGKVLKNRIMSSGHDTTIPTEGKVNEALIAYCHAGGVVLLSQIFHPGREIMESPDGLLSVAYSASSVPNERFHVMPRELGKAQIGQMVQSHADSAVRPQMVLPGVRKLF